MSPFIKDASVQAVLSAANIVDVVSGYTSLRKRGATYSGLCPFHQEKTPSFTVSAEKGLYYCFGCGEGGDVVRFLERMENLSFAEAIEQLGERFGVPVEYEEGAGPTPAARTGTPVFCRRSRRRPRFTSGSCGKQKAASVAREYLEKRGLGQEVCRTFRVGFSPDEWRGLHRRATKEGFTDRELEDAGLLVRQTGKTYDRFRGRLMFPLVDHRGRVLGFGGRTLKDETPKYLNSPEGPLYQKGHLLYGLYQARKAIADADEVVVVEGYTDVLGLVQAGVGNVVASMGTALTDAQIGLMMRFTEQRHLHVRRRPGGHRGHAALGRAGPRPFAAAHGAPCCPAAGTPPTWRWRAARRPSHASRRARSRFWGSSCARRWPAATPPRPTAGCGRSKRCARS